MTLENYLQKIDHLDYLIRSESTGPPKALAAKLDISESSIYRLINTLKERGAPIAYCPTIRSYLYLCEGKFSTKFLSKE